MKSLVQTTSQVLSCSDHICALSADNKYGSREAKLTDAYRAFTFLPDRRAEAERYLASCVICAASGSIQAHGRGGSSEEFWVSFSFLALYQLSDESDVCTFVRY